MVSWQEGKRKRCLRFNGGDTALIPKNPTLEAQHRDIGTILLKGERMLRIKFATNPKSQRIRKQVGSRLAGSKRRQHKQRGAATQVT
jgi:hypothetical protein